MEIGSDDEELPIQRRAADRSALRQVAQLDLEGEV